MPTSIDDACDNVLPLSVAVDERRSHAFENNEMPPKKRRGQPVVLWILVIAFILGFLGSGWYGLRIFTQLTDRVEQTNARLEDMQKKILGVSDKASRTDKTLSQSDSAVQLQLQKINAEITHRLSLLVQANKKARNRLAQQLKQQTIANEHKADDAAKSRRALQDTIAHEGASLEKHDHKLKMLEQQQEQWIAVQKMTDSNRQELIVLKKQLQQYKDVVQSMDQYRKQINRQLLVLQKQLQKKAK